MPLTPGTTLGPYRILAPIGSGGMGEVYRAEDPRLGRPVAIKVLPAEVSRSPDRRQRFEREARAIAALNHPHICAIYDVGRDGELDFLVMELLEGESLAARLARGPVPFSEAAPIARAMLQTLQAVHDRGLVHRDLKPANIFLTRHGVKLLDFGVARHVERGAEADTALTQLGMVVGTPRYMAPEQLRGGAADHRSDIFSAAALIYEMLAGRPPFDGPSVVDVLHAVAFEDAPELPDGLAPAVVARAVRQALSRRPDDRPATALGFASVFQSDGDVSTASSGTPAVGSATAAAAPTRLVVMPFRVLRPDPETDFLGFSLADAVAASLAGLESIVVRSTISAAAWGAGTLDLRALAEQLQVDVALTGSLIRAGNQVRVAAQLVEVPGGSLVWSHTVQSPVQDLFQLQDALSHAIVSSLHLRLSARDRRLLRRDVPASAPAYELYLRGNQLMTDSSGWKDSRELYERAVELDPGYAPAWARLGRVLRVLAKYGSTDPAGDRARAEQAFQRALALNPDLALAHCLYAYLEVELGRAQDAMTRLIARARALPDAELFAGLVVACRYCGLIGPAIEAHARARQLDASVSTSVAYAYYLRGDYAMAAETDTGTPRFLLQLARLRAGDVRGALGFLREIADASPHHAQRLVAVTYIAAVERDRDALLRNLQALRTTGFRDPEGYFFLAVEMIAGGIHDHGLAVLDDSVASGYTVPSTLREDPLLDPVRDSQGFTAILAQADERHARSRQAYIDAGGPALLGPC